MPSIHLLRPEIVTRIAAAKIADDSVRITHRRILRHYDPTPSGGGRTVLIGAALGSSVPAYGSTIAALDFPRYAALANAGRLPIEQLIDARIGPAEVNDALSAMRRGETVRRILVLSTPAWSST